MKGSNDVKAASNGINKLYAQLLGAKLNGASGADISSASRRRSPRRTRSWRATTR